MIIGPGSPLICVSDAQNKSGNPEDALTVGGLYFVQEVVAPEDYGTECPACDGSCTEAYLLKDKGQWCSEPDGPVTWQRCYCPTLFKPLGGEGVSVGRRIAEPA